MYMVLINIDVKQRNKIKKFILTFKLKRLKSQSEAIFPNVEGLVGKVRL